MPTLENFLRTGHFGPVMLGMSPTKVMAALGDPDDISKKTNPLQLKYGCAHLSFWKASKQRTQQLRDIAIVYQPQLEPLPKSLAFTDWNPIEPPTVEQFDAFLHHINYLPVSRTDGPTSTQLAFLSGATAVFNNGILHSIRLFQHERKEPNVTRLSDEREPTTQQIIDMFDEADRASQIGAYRAALLMAWAGLEAVLRRSALSVGREGKIGVQPSILIRELVAAGKLTAAEHSSIEELRQLRTASAHGLSPNPFDVNKIRTIRMLSNRLLDAANIRSDLNQADAERHQAVDAKESWLRSSISVSAPIRYKFPDFQPLITRLQEIRSHLIQDYDRVEQLLPNALTGNEKITGFSEDARLTGLAHLIRLVDCTLLSFTLINDDLLPPDNKWWDAVRTQPLNSFNHSHRSMTVNSFNNSFIKFAFLHKLFSTIENTSRLVLRALDPAAANNASASISSVWRELFPRLTAQAPNWVDLLTLLRLSRNTIHNNGVYVSNQQHNDQVIYKGEIFDFTHMKPVNFVNWTFLIERLDDVRELLVSIVSDANVIGITNPILDPFATNRTVLP